MVWPFLILGDKKIRWWHDYCRKATQWCFAQWLSSPLPSRRRTPSHFQVALSQFHRSIIAHDINSQSSHGKCNQFMRNWIEQSIQLRIKRSGAFDVAQNSPKLLWVLIVEHSPGGAQHGIGLTGKSCGVEHHLPTAYLMEYLVKVNQQLGKKSDTYWYMHGAQPCSSNSGGWVHW